MNKVTLTSQGRTLFVAEQEEESVSPDPATLPTKRSISLPHLVSTATFTERQEVNKTLSKLTTQLKGLQQKGLRKILMEK